MSERLKSLGGLFVYVLAGLAALLMASWVSTQFMSKALSQTPQVQPDVVGEAPPPPPPPPQVPAEQAPPPQPQAAAPVAPPQAPAAQPQVPPAVPQAGGQQAGPPPPQAGAARGVPGADASLKKAPGLGIKANALADIIEDYTYNGQTKRDPFLPFEKPVTSNTILGPFWPLQRFDLDQLKLVGIIWDVRNPKAMILDPTGKGYVIKVNERIGRNNGYVARIREGEVVIVESVVGSDGKLFYSTKLMKLQTE